MTNKTHVIICLRDGSEDVVPINSLSLSKRAKGFSCASQVKEYEYRYHNDATNTGGILKEEQYLHLIDVLNRIVIT